MRKRRKRERAKTRMRRSLRLQAARAALKEAQEDRPRVVRPLPEPPEHLTGEERENWLVQARIDRRLADRQEMEEAWERGETAVIPGGF